MQGGYSSMSGPYMTMTPHMMERERGFGMLNLDLCVGSIGVGNGCTPYPNQGLQPVPAPSFKEAAWQLHEVTRQMQQLARQLSDARQQQAQHSASFHVLLKDLVSTQKQQHTALESLRSLQVEPDMLQPTPQSLAANPEVIHALTQELQYYKHLAQEQQHNPKVLQLQSHLDATHHELAATQQLNTRLMHERSTLIMRLQQLMHQLVTLQDKPALHSNHPLDAMDGAIQTLDGVIAGKLNELTNQMAGLCVELADGAVSSRLDGDDMSCGTFDSVSLGGGREGYRSVDETAALLGESRRSGRVEVFEQGTSTDDLGGESERVGANAAGVHANAKGVHANGVGSSAEVMLLDIRDVHEERERREGEHAAEVESLRSELQESKVQLEESKEQLHVSEQKLQDLQLELQRQEAAARELVVAKEKLEALIRNEEEVAAKMQDLEGQLREQQQLKKDLEHAQQHVEQLYMKLQEAEEAKQQVQALTLQLEQQQQVQTKLQEANKELQEAHVKLQETNKQLEQSHSHLQQQLNTSLADLISTQNERAQLQSDIAALQQQAEQHASLSHPPQQSALPRDGHPTIDPTLPMLMEPELIPSPSPTFLTTKSQRLDAAKAQGASGNGADTPTGTTGTVTPVGRGGPMEAPSSLLLANSQLEALKRQRDEAEAKLQSLLGLIQQAMAQEISNTSDSSQGTSKVAELAALHKLCAVLTPASCVRSSAAVLTQRSSQLQATMQAALAEIKSLRAELTADVTDGPILDPVVEVGPAGKTLLGSIQEKIPLEEADTSSIASDLPPPPDGIPPEWQELYYKDAKKFNELWQEARTSVDASGSLWPKQEPQELPLLDQLGSQPPCATPLDQYDHIDTHGLYAHSHDTGVIHPGPPMVPDPSTMPPPPPGLDPDLVALYYELGPEMFYQLLNDAQQEAHT